MIALPGPEPGRFEEWGYAERGWYLEGRQGLTGAIRAMLWPSAGVIEVARTERLWAERTPDPPAETFALEVGAEGLARLREHLRSTIAGPEPWPRSARAASSPLGARITSFTSAISTPPTPCARPACP